MLFLISEALNFSPLSGKVCLNSIPKALTDKFNNNQELFNELKQFIENSSLIDSKHNSFWTFPEFKTPSDQGIDAQIHDNRRDIVFPDPKYYMIGFRVEKTGKEYENVFSDWESNHTKTNDTLKQSMTKKSSPLETDELVENSWKNVSTTITKPILHPIEVKR